MPIKGLTDRKLAFPEIGQIRKGAPKTGNKPGKDLPYFRVVFDEAEKEAERIFRSVYGAQPREINILLPFNELDRVWEAWLEAYTAGRMVARADGEKFLYLLDTETGDVVVKDGIDVKTGQPRPYVEGAPVGYYTDKHGQRQPIFCKPVGRLKVVIPELRRLAYLTVLTTSIHDIINIDSQLQALQRVNGGKIAGIPLVLRRRPKKVSVPKPDGQRVRMTKYLLSVEADERWVKAAVAALEAASRPMLAARPAAALPAEDGVRDMEDGMRDEGLGMRDEEGREAAFEEAEFVDAEFEEVPQERERQDAKKAEDARGAPQERQERQGRQEKEEAERPYPPDELQARIRGVVAYYRSNGVPENNLKGKQGVIVKILETTFNGAKSARYAVSAFLLGEGKESTKTWTPEETLAMWRWLKPEKDEETGEWLPDADSVKEAVKVYEAALEAQGQRDLAIGD